jgi:hypothetical protein
MRLQSVVVELPLGIQLEVAVENTRPRAGRNQVVEEGGTGLEGGPVLVGELRPWMTEVPNIARAVEAGIDMADVHHPGPALSKEGEDRRPGDRGNARQTDTVTRVDALQVDWRSTGVVVDTGPVDWGRWDREKGPTFVGQQVRSLTLGKNGRGGQQRRRMM